MLITELQVLNNSSNIDHVTESSFNGRNELLL